MNERLAVAEPRTAEVSPETEWAMAPRTQRRLGYLAAGVGVAAVWATTIWTSTHVTADEQLQTAALFVHLGSLVVGMGAVLTLDWLSLRWLFGRLTRQDVMRMAGSSHVLIWGGLAGLCVSGALLRPDPTSLMTQIKLAAVLVLALNGLTAHALQHRLNQVPLSRPLMLRAALVAGVSQAGWWTATVVGFLNHR